MARPRRPDRRPPEKDRTPVNERIRSKQIRLIASDGSQVGVVSRAEALRYAEKAELDLVEVAAGDPAVCKVMDYSKHRYEQKKHEREAKRNSKQVELREIKLRPKIAEHDYETKRRHVVRFLEHGAKVRVTIMFRGRENAHPELGEKLLLRVAESVSGLAKIESAPRREGRNMFMLLTPLPQKPKAESQSEPEPDRVG